MVLNYSNIFILLYDSKLIGGKVSIYLISQKYIIIKYRSPWLDCVEFKNDDLYEQFFLPIIIWKTLLLIIIN